MIIWVFPSGFKITVEPIISSFVCEQAIGHRTKQGSWLKRTDTNSSMYQKHTGWGRRPNPPQNLFAQHSTMASAGTMGIRPLHLLHGLCCIGHALYATGLHHELPPADQPLKIQHSQEHLISCLSSSCQRMGNIGRVYRQPKQQCPLYMS